MSDGGDPLSSFGFEGVVSAPAIDTNADAAGRTVCATPVRRWRIRGR